MRYPNIVFLSWFKCMQTSVLLISAEVILILLFFSCSTCKIVILELILVNLASKEEIYSKFGVP